MQCFLQDNNGSSFKLEKSGTRCFLGGDPAMRMNGGQHRMTIMKFMFALIPCANNNNNESYSPVVACYCQLDHSSHRAVPHTVVASMSG